MVGLGRRHRTLAIVVPCERVPDGVEQLRQLGLCDLAVVVRIKLQVHHTHNPCSNEVQSQCVEQRTSRQDVEERWWVVGPTNLSEHGVHLRQLLL